MASNSFYILEIAKKDLDETLDYISTVLHNPNAAKQLFEEIERTFERIISFPESSPLVENEFLNRKDIRKATVNSFVIYYLYEETTRTITILRFVYGKRDLNQLLKNI